MGSSETGMAGCGVGRIVWVRRRNGSWWPGKILGSEELFSSHVTSPPFGTPVKLLGREDASVDWYNLERSKRVKPFRCGEFDDCIERVESAQGMPPKKREKYARREDAILHALELERRSLETKNGKVENSLSGRRKMSPEAVTSSEYLESVGGDHEDTRSDQIPEERLGLSLAETSVVVQLPHDQIAREGDQVSGDDDSASVLPRMRGLQDFGLSTTLIRQEFPEIRFLTKSRYAYLPYGSGDYPNENQTISSQMELPATDIEQSGFPINVGEDHISGSTEDTETDCSETNSSDSVEMTGVSVGSASIELHPKYPRMIEDEHVSISSNDNLNESAFDEATSMGISQWNLKGKRINCTLGKRSLDIANTEVSRGYANGRCLNSKNLALKTDLIDKCFWTHVPGYGSPGLQNPNVIVDSWNNNHYATRGYWDDGQESMVPFLAGRTMLIDVDLRVQANNYRRDVPMISLMSKLNGHVIVGHPILVEALESDSTDNLLSSFPEAPEIHTRQLSSLWKTGRRRPKSRIPRPFMSSSLNRELQYDSNQTNTHQQQKNSYKSSRKIRTLSSIAMEQKQQVSGGNYGTMKIQTPSSRAWTATVACIPVKLLFSRLHEELIGHHQ